MSIFSDKIITGNIMEDMPLTVIFVAVVVLGWWMFSSHDHSIKKVQEERKLKKEKADKIAKTLSEAKEKAEIAKNKAEVARLEEEKALEVARLEEEMELEVARLEEEWAREAARQEKEKAREIARQEKEAADLVIAEENFKLRLSTLKTNLPFHTSKKTPSAELADHDKGMWDDVTKLVKEQDSKKATLYFVKIKSLMDDNEYFKIGMTTVGVKARFKKSTQVELLETVCSFDTELWKAAYLEYHFLREFRLYDGLSTSIGEQRPEVGFSGYTEVVRSNSVNKISEYFEELGTYNEME